MEILRRSPHALSGTALGQRLHLGRPAVWRHIQGLKKRGYRIESLPARGYRLHGIPDRLFPAEILRHLRTAVMGRHIHYFPTIDSTNVRAFHLARDGAKEGEVVIAEEQSKGKGRLGRQWESPFGVNLYMSIILRPAVLPEQVPQLSLVAALAVAETVRTMVGVQPGIKWPNDVVIDGKKLAGILTELHSERDAVKFVIVGPGVNLNATREHFPMDLQHVATSLFLETGRRVDRAAFTGQLLNLLEDHYRLWKGGGLTPFLPRWRQYSCLDKRHVIVKISGQEVPGQVLGIDHDGALLLRNDRGEKRRVIAGDVTVVDGYSSKKEARGKRP